MKVMCQIHTCMSPDNLLHPLLFSKVPVNQGHHLLSLGHSVFMFYFPALRLWDPSWRSQIPIPPLPCRIISFGKPGSGDIVSLAVQCFLSNPLSIKSNRNIKENITYILYCYNCIISVIIKKKTWGQNIRKFESSFFLFNLFICVRWGLINWLAGWLVVFLFSFDLFWDKVFL